MSKPTISIATSIDIAAPIENAFDLAVSTPPMAFIGRVGPLPGVAAFTGAGRWRTVGDQRRLTLDDGGSVSERLLSFAEGSSFSYAASDFTGLFASLVAQARGDWHFTRSGPGSTRIDWTYSFTPTHPLAEPILWFVVKLFWPGYMRKALHLLKTAAENDAS